MGRIASDAGIFPDRTAVDRRPQKVQRVNHIRYRLCDEEDRKRCSKQRPALVSSCMVKEEVRSRGPTA